MVGHVVKIRTFILAGAAANAALLLSSGTAHAADTLAWSLAATGVGSCSTTPCIEGTTLSFQDRDVEYALGINASKNSSHPVYGTAQASAEPGAGVFSLPQLHAAVTAENGPGGFAYNYAIAHAVQGYRWDGLTGVDLGVDTFIGTVDFTASTAGYSFVTAGIAIISGVLRDNDALGRLWYRPDGFGDFTADCDTEGAIAIGSTGPDFSRGSVTRVIAPTCGAATFHVEPGEEFFIWARLEAFHAGAGFTDAAHTFSVAINPDLPEEKLTLLTESLSIAPALAISAVPEPMTWTMMIVGFGLTGAALRRRKVVFAA